MVRRFDFGYCCVVIHVMATAIGTLLGVLGFPFLNGIFVQLDSVNCVCGSSLALMAFPDEARIGFVDLDNCTALFVIGIVATILLFILSGLVILKKRSAMFIVLATYVLDLTFLVIHYINLPDMIYLQTLGNYTLFSSIYKILGIVIIQVTLKRMRLRPTSSC